MSDPLSDVDAVRDAIIGIFGQEAPPWAIVLGSGLGSFTRGLDDAISVPYQNLGIPEPLVPGHAGSLVVGRIGAVRVACLSGRVHLYEGHPPDRVVLGLRALLRWGVRRVALTASVGSLRTGCGPGSLVVVRDHISFLGQNPLYGPNIGEFGPRFPDLSHAYTPDLRAAALVQASEMGIVLTEGVYAAMPGPSFETPAEVRMLDVLGADVVGMSLVPEVVATAHARVPLIACGVVANLAAGLSDVPLEHDALTAAVSRSVDDLARLLRNLVART